MIVANLSSSNGNTNARNSDNYASNSSSSVRSSISRSSGGSCTLGYSSAQKIVEVLVVMVEKGVVVVVVVCSGGLKTTRAPMHGDDQGVLLHPRT